MRGITAAALTALLVLTGCGGGDDRKTDGADGAKQGSRNEERPRPKAFDPPKRFEPASSPMPLSVEDDQTDSDAPEPQIDDPAFVGSRHLIGRVDSRGTELFDATSSKPRMTLGPDVTSGTKPATEPAVETPAEGYAVDATLDGQNLFLVAYHQTVKGSGTTKDHPQVRVQAINPKTRTVEWVADADLTGGPDPSDNPVERVVVDEKSGLAAVEVTEYDDSYVVLVDLRAKKGLWTRENAALAGLADGVVAVSDGGGLHGLDARDQSERWSLPSVEELTPAGGSDDLFLVAEPAGDYFRSEITVTDSSGKQVAKHAPKSKVPANAWTCVDDDQSVVVCTAGKAGMVAFQRDSGKVLWHYDSDTRAVPEITAAYHGMVYGETDNGPVMLNAKTGEDEPTEANVAPRVVTPFAAADIRETKVPDDFGGTDEVDAVTYYKTAG